MGGKLDVPWQSWRREVKKRTKKAATRTGKNEAELVGKAFIVHGLVLINTIWSTGIYSNGCVNEIFV